MRPTDRLAQERPWGRWAALLGRREREVWRGPDDDEPPEVYGEPVPWAEARARLRTPVHFAVADVLEQAGERLPGVAVLEAFGLEGSVMLRLAPTRQDAAWVGIMAFLEHANLHAAVDGHWMEWEGDGDAEEAADRLRAQVAAAVEGRVAVLRCHAGATWREGFDLFEIRDGKRSRTYSSRYLGDPWLRGERILVRYAPYGQPRE